MAKIRFDHGGFTVRRWTTPVWAANVYLVRDVESSEGMLVDAGGKAKDILVHLKKHDINLKYIVLTHKHLDHSAAAWKLKRATGARILGGLGDLLFSRKSFDRGGKALTEGDVLEIGSTKAKVLTTPGHTKGGISLVVAGAVFTGDTLFAGGIGRTDLPGGNLNAIFDSIRNKLLTLPDETVVYPGHGPPSDIGRERSSNPFLTGEFDY